MRIGITGHSSGLGQGLYNFFKDAGFYVRGYSRSNGYNVDPEDWNNIVKIFDDVKKNRIDTFINNAYFGTAQEKVFETIYNYFEECKLSKDSDIAKNNFTILNVNSRLGLLTEEYYSAYAFEKQKQHSISNPALHVHRNTRVINYFPGYIDTPMLADLEGSEKIKPERILSVDEAVDVVFYALGMPHNVELGVIGHWKMSYLPNMTEVERWDSKYDRKQHDVIPP